MISKKKKKVPEALLSKKNDRVLCHFQKCTSSFPFICPIRCTFFCFYFTGKSPLSLFSSLLVIRRDGVFRSPIKTSRKGGKLVFRLNFPATGFPCETAKKWRLQLWGNIFAEFREREARTDVVVCTRGRRLFNFAGHHPPIPHIPIKVNTYTPEPKGKENSKLPGTIGMKKTFQIPYEFQLIISFFETLGFPGSPPP